MEKISISQEDLRKLISDVAQIKEILIAEREELEEIELTDWAEKELAEARSRQEKEYISLEEVKNKILSKK